MEMVIYSVILLLLYVARLSYACPDLCMCADGSYTLRCININLTPEYLRNIVIPTTTKEVYITSNKLAKISRDVLRPFRHATRLEITRNLVEKIPPNTFVEFENLTRLTLEGNKIRELHPNSFSGLTKLIRLNIADNKLTYLYEGMFDDVASVSSLKLMRNGLQAIPNGVFTRMPLLQDLFIGHNKISRLGDRAFQNMSMYKLDLTYNDIKRIPRSAFLNFKIKYKILLYYNRLECNCVDVMTYARDFKELQLVIWGVCHSPANLKDKSILIAYTYTDCTLCDLNLCKNGGTCQGNKTSFICVCPDQFKR